jgi:peptidoglycan/LPS O-acetylase OafA/YrhL
MRTIAHALDVHRGKAPGADTLRFLLAFGVIVHHSFPLTLGPHHDVAVAVTSVGERIMVPMFIALSGFLVTASAMRTSLAQFVLNRALRIFPGLIVVTVLTACLLGPAVTSLPWFDYFTSSVFWRYFSNGLAWVRYQLPGVFDTNPIDAVNGSLWSIPVELQCYAVLGLMMLAGLLRWRSTILLALLLALLLNAIPEAVNGQSGVHFIVSNFLRLFVYFAAGAFAFLYREWIPIHFSLVSAAVGVAVLVLLGGWQSPLMPILMSYCAVCLALTPMRAPPGGDYSYGIYIYAFPIQQTVVMAIPHQDWWMNIIVSFPLVLALAVASWHFVEWPALNMKTRLRVPKSRAPSAAPQPESTAA